VVLLTAAADGAEQAALATRRARLGQDAGKGITVPQAVAALAFGAELGASGPVAILADRGGRVNGGIDNGRGARRVSN
jgi:hypothetical protein